VGDLMELCSGWVEASGGEVACELGVEVSPLLSYAGEGLQVRCGSAAGPQQSVQPGRRVAAPGWSRRRRACCRPPLLVAGPACKRLRAACCIPFPPPAATRPHSRPTLVPRRTTRQALAEGQAFGEPYNAALQGAAAGPAASRSNAGPWLAPLALAYLGVAVLKVLGK
jgi:hypothetical protein